MEYGYKFQNALTSSLFSGMLANQYESALCNIVSKGKTKTFPKVNLKLGALHTHTFSLHAKSFKTITIQGLVNMKLLMGSGSGSL